MTHNNPKTMIIEALATAFYESFKELVSFVEEGKLVDGTSVTVGVSQIQIDGKWYEIQLRLESSEASFLDEKGIVQSRQLGDSITKS